MSGMFFKILSIFITLNFLLITCQSAKRQLNIELYNHTCQAFGKRLKLFKCSFLKLNNVHYLFNQTYKFDRDMDNEFKLRIWIDAKPTFAKMFLRFADIRFDTCSFFQQNFDFQFLRLISQDFKKFTNLPQKCPFKGNVVYKINNFPVTSQYIPVYAPACNFTFGIDYYDSSNLFGSTKLIGSLIV